jgi:hypothetical protein
MPTLLQPLFSAGKPSPPDRGGYLRKMPAAILDRMEKLDCWIANGRLVAGPQGPGKALLSERVLLDRHHQVKVSISEDGTTVKWLAAAANWSSLHFAKEWIGNLRGPYTLNYYISGWFTETHAGVEEARDRIDQLIAKSDVHLSSRVYVKEFDPLAHPPPDSLRECLETGEVPQDSSIDCWIDDATGRVRVERIGSQSAIAKLWGISPVSAPCLSGTSYDSVVSRAYGHVLRTGKPHYDHIYAAMVGPDGEVSWIPYQRIVMRHPASRSRHRLVSVVSELTPVEIAVV